jgi:transposase-like protein
MKKKITYLVKYMDEVIKEVLIHTKDIKTQVELLKNRQVLDEAIKKLEKKYDNIIKDIQNDIEEERPDEK